MKNTTAGAKGTTTIAAPSATEKAKFQGARLKAIMEDPLAHSLITRNDFRVAKGLEFHAILHEIPIEQIARFYDFEEEDINEILYARKIKEQKPEVFYSIEKKVNQKECPYVQIEKMTTEDFSSLFLEKDLFAACRTNFPSLPVYKIPGESNRMKNILLFLPSCTNNDKHNFPVINLLAGHGFYGSTVLPLFTGKNISKLVYSLIQQKKVDAIINFFSSGHHDSAWHDYENHLTSNLGLSPGEVLKFKSCLDAIAKNYFCTIHGGIDPYEVRNTLVSKILSSK